MPTMRFWSLVLLQVVRCLAAINYTDTAIAPSADHYNRYATFLAVGTRLYTCSGNDSAPYTFKSFEYDMYDAETDPNTTASLGKHVLLPEKDAWGGNSVFYTATNTFTYWVGKSLRFAPDPASEGPEDLTLELALRTQASEPKPEAGKYDLGQTVYVTRFGAIGGNPQGPCEGTTEVESEVYYSLWSQYA